MRHQQRRAPSLVAVAAAPVVTAVAVAAAVVAVVVVVVEETAAVDVVTAAATVDVVIAAEAAATVDVVTAAAAVDVVTAAASEKAHRRGGDSRSGMTTCRARLRLHRAAYTAIVPNSSPTSSTPISDQLATGDRLTVRKWRS